ncbi:hypothetical protein P389DRAFT_197221 [Cystobasidium minutum MCA 4210]|uniref:uncharacterized protein n=1 Tax=Cystobasidium minutum MCA 4210 TaxID=1397322 RepID=UPI0034CD7D45|eukprot:jgi/Rhomi1/197221/gm1.5435_g
MAENTLPDGSFNFNFEEVTRLSEKDAEYIARWKAEGFKADCFGYIVSQKTFAEDPQAHYLWQRVMLDRAEGDGYYIVNKTRTAIQIIFPPGKQDRRLDMSYTSPRDENWKLFLDHCGGAEAVTARITPYLVAAAADLKKVYGDDMGVTLHEIGGFAVRPEFQRKGLGRALREYTESKAMRADTKAFFTALEYNLPFYRKLGCKVVGDKVPTGLDEAGRKAYPPGNDYTWLCEGFPAKKTERESRTWFDFLTFRLPYAN